MDTQSYHDPSKSLFFNIGSKIDWSYLIYEETLRKEKKSEVVAFAINSYLKELFSLHLHSPVYVLFCSTSQMKRPSS